jgi:Holliday junction resolvasome RuvABC ATP-dependent DNA helicase subunit
MGATGMKLDIKKIWNKHFGIEEEQQEVDTAPKGFDKIDGFEDIKKVVRQAINDNKRHGILFVGPPACSKTLFLEAVIEEAGEGLYFDGTNTTNKILDVLNDERPNIICIDELEKMPKNFQEKILNLCESGRVDVDQKKTQYHFKLENLKIFAAANDKTRLSKPLHSRFLVLQLPKPTEQQFIGIAEKLTPHLSKTAGFIAKCVYAKGRDMREYRQIADFVEIGWSEQDELELMETMNRYSEQEKEEIGDRYA